MNQPAIADPDGDVNARPDRNTQPAPRRGWRRWFQYGLSSLALLTLVVAVFCAWAASERRERLRKVQLLEQITKCGGTYKSEVASASWSNKVLGVPRWQVKRITLDETDRELFDGTLTWLAEFPELEELLLDGCEILDVIAIENISRLQHLKTLSLDASLPRGSIDPLNQLQNLEQLVLRADEARFTQERFPAGEN